MQDLVGNLKGSPDTIRKRLSTLGKPNALPRTSPPPSGRSLAGWSSDRERTNAEWLIEIGLPLLAVLGSALAKMFMK